MAKKKLLQSFLKNTLNTKETDKVKGGRSYVPTTTGSYGYVNWDDVTIREPGVFAPLPTSHLELG